MQGSYGEEGKASLGVRAVRLVLWVVAVVSAGYVGSVFWDGLEAAGYRGDSGQRWIPFAGLAAVAGAVFALLWSYRSRRSRGELIVPAGLVAIALAITAGLVYESRDNGEHLVWDYCSYGASSTAQWIGCVKHVSPGQVVYSNTPAADFANGKTDTCGAGSGPFCGEAARDREISEALEKLKRE